ncbi:unnamed protein product [Microthlaspi erraticum]|uniref:Uncharacterized protein n=1 Tax=Microthlaspi erraticum TaxID=1685480 RepID=A0A6D2IKN3_9BRAS|nr:unnamed protein product [Microthlaspi erraticum]
MLTARDEYGLRDEAVGEVIHENMADDYNNYGDVKQLGMSYEKVDHSGRLQGHNYRDKLRYYEVEGRTSIKQFRNLVDERSFANDGHRVSTLRPRVSAKDRLGGRVGDSGVLVRNQELHRVRNSNLKGKSSNRRFQKNVW